LKNKLDKIRTDLTAALIEVGAMNGVVFKVGNMRYTNNDVKIVVEAFDTDGAAADADFDRMAWNKGCYRYGFAEDDYGKTFTTNGRTFTIAGLKPKNTKYPIIGTGPEGGRYKFPIAAVRRGLAA